MLLPIIITYLILGNPENPDYDEPIIVEKIEINDTWITPMPATLPTTPLPTRPVIRTSPRPPPTTRNPPTTTSSYVYHHTKDRQVRPDVITPPPPFPTDSTTTTTAATSRLSAAMFQQGPFPTKIIAELHPPGATQSYSYTVSNQGGKSRVTAMSHGVIYPPPPIPTINPSLFLLLTSSTTSTTTPPPTTSTTTTEITPPATTTTEATTTTTSTTSTTTTETPREPSVAVSATSKIDNHQASFLVSNARPKRSCMEHKKERRPTGIYKIDPDGKGEFSVLCDMDTEGGGWAVLQKRVNNQEEFHGKYYKHYENGFGSLQENFWLGLSYMQRLAPAEYDLQTLRIELRGDTCTASGCSEQKDGFWWGEWEFTLGDRDEGYKLNIEPRLLAGNMTDPDAAELRNPGWEHLSKGMRFTTIDNDNDYSNEMNCAQFRSLGGWWHHDCTNLSLNGRYGDKMGGMRYMAFSYRNGHENYFVKPRQTLMMARPRL